jgi:cyclic pyranopterin phosphate synthase
MTLRARVRQWLAPTLKTHPWIWRRIVATDRRIEAARHSAAAALPVLIRPATRRIEIAITAQCNLRCMGCRYGRDFMPGHELAWPMVRDLLHDCAALGIWDVRLYGGEPLVHPDLPRMVELATQLRLETHVTTNAILLGRKIEELYEAGLRQVTIGYYGTGERYNAYVQRRDRHRLLEESVARVRERFGTAVRMRINWLLMRPSCNLDDLHQAIAFAEKYDLTMQVDLVHYSLPYFTEGPERCLQFRESDRPAIEAVVAELVRLKLEKPLLLNQSIEGLRSIPEWLLLGPDMRVPCDSYQTVWVGPDGTVQQCYVTFRLGNLHEQRLRDILYTATHRQAAIDSFRLACPNCHCHYDGRVHKHAPALAAYRNPRPSPGPAPAAGS